MSEGLAPHDSESSARFFLEAAFASMILGDVDQWQVYSGRALGVMDETELSAYRVARSEEHTSELQSRQYLVCRLLLEKKKEKRIKLKIIYIGKHASTSGSARKFITGVAEIIALTL